MITVEELAKLLRLNPQTIYRKVQKGEIPAIKIGGAIRFDSDAINKWFINASIQSNRRVV